MAWNELSLSDRARMIQLAVKSGITDLSTIQEVYNTFAEGGPKKNKDLSDQEYYKIMERVAEENYSKWGMKSPEEALTHVLNDNTYDYRGYYSKYPNSRANADTHWPDEFKTAYHPTFSEESIYSGKKSRFNPEGIIGGHWEGDRFIPSSGQHKYLTGGDKEGTDNPFEYARNQYTTNTMTADFARELNDSVMARNFGFSPEAIAYAIGTESGYRTNAKNKNSSARGILQLTKPTIQQIYGLKKGAEIYQQYVDGTRTQTDQIHDAMMYLQKRDDNITTNREDMSAGRVKANLLAPNSSMNSIISDAVWQHSLSNDYMSRLQRGKSTYNDLSDIYNQDFDIFLQGFNAQKPKKAKKKK